MRGKESQEEWTAEKRMYEGIYASRTGRETQIVDIVEDELGYTGKDGKIHLKREHPVMDGMVQSEKVAFRAGVFCHEMLHQLFTDFVHLDEVLEQITDGKKKQVAMLFANLIEDPAIEHRAPEVVGGSLLKALNYSIRTIYQQAPEIDNPDKPFTELCDALIQFGDMGLIKGSFSKDSLPYFKKIAPEFHEQILNPISAERIDAAVRWAEITRPLWESKSKEDIQKEADQVMDHASAPMNGSGTGEQPPQEEKQDEEGNEGKGKDEKDEIREDLLKRLQSGEPVTMTKDEAADKAEQITTLNAEDFQQLGQEIWDSMDPYEKESASELPLLTLPEINMPEYHGTRCNNIPADTVGKRNEYEALVNKRDVRMLTRSLRTIFLNDMNEDLRATSGRYNILRGVKGNTVKVFDKRKERRNIDDLAIMVLVDESGSMSGKRIENAKKAAVLLAETFGNLNIPCSIIGFTADEDMDVTHRHYVSWRNSAIERTSIASMMARVNNFDGFSIRYAGRILQKRNAEHKIMFVISDGLPNCRNYRNEREGVKDTADAIREMGRFMTVMGIGIGDKNDLYPRMYGGSFVNCEPDSLAGELTKQLKRIIKRIA